MFRKHFDYDVDAASVEAAIPADQQGISLTLQSQAQDADINFIVHRFGITGRLPESVRVPTFADFDGVFDFRSAQEALINAQRDFNALPARVRARFDNDPQMMLEFCSQESNRAEMRELGLLRDDVVVDTPKEGA